MRVISLLLAILSLAATFGLAQAADIAKVDRIVVEKSAHTLTLFAAGRVVKTYRVAIGVGSPGNKESGGDDRTPEGSYLIDAKNPASEFHRALHISYPNKIDRTAAKQRGVRLGGLIAIHGTPDFIEKIQDAGSYPDWTAGCIGVRNTEIEEIYALVPVGTPIEIKP
jgi:murein L,D-transpeptidase YafK